VHEIMHSLGFSGYFMNNYFKDPSTGEAYTTGPVVVVAERGRTDVRKLATPRVLAHARDHFNCPTLNGMELEGQGGSGTGASHWDSRLVRNYDVMGPAQSAFESTLSQMTLAYFEDSGHYQANYSQAGILHLGYKAGCGFAVDKCLNSVQARPPNTDTAFCEPAEESSSTDFCSADRAAKSYCATATYNSALPSEYQYYPGQASRGGYISYADYCPVVLPFSNTYCSDTSTSVYSFETVGPNSLCFTGTVRPSTSAALTSAEAQCFNHRCQGNSLEVYVGGTWLACPSAGGSVTAGVGYQGQVICPPSAEWCGGINCPGACSGAGTCNGHTGVCECMPWRTGTDCSIAMPGYVGEIPAGFNQTSVPTPAPTPAPNPAPTPAPMAGPTPAPTAGPGGGNLNANGSVAPSSSNLTCSTVRFEIVFVGNFDADVLERAPVAQAFREALAQAAGLPGYTYIVLTLAKVCKCDASCLAQTGCGESALQSVLSSRSKALRRGLQSSGDLHLKFYAIAPPAKAATDVKDALSDSQKFASATQAALASHPSGNFTNITVAPIQGVSPQLVELPVADLPADSRAVYERDLASSSASAPSSAEVGVSPFGWALIVFFSVFIVIACILGAFMLAQKFTLKEKDATSDAALESAKVDEDPVRPGFLGGLFGRILHPFGGGNSLEVAKAKKYIVGRNDVTLFDVARHLDVSVADLLTLNQKSLGRKAHKKTVVKAGMVLHYIPNAYI